MAIVTIVQRRLNNYRVPLFERMRSRLGDHGIELRLVHGVGTPDELCKDDAGDLDWAIPVETHYLLGQRVCWQPYLPLVKGSDLIVMAHENKQVANFVTLFRYHQSGPRLAFWGHGKNMQARNADSVSERFKRWTLRQVDWWFAYTELSRGFVDEAGFPRDRITVLNNSIDTGELRAALDRVRHLGDTAALRAEFGLGAGPVGLFIGSLYADKRLPFLVEAARQIHERLPGFELVIAGDGDERGFIEAAAKQHRFIRYLGAVKGDRKARLLAASSLVLNPGLVGLAILDAFVAGLPMFTTDCGLHSPEIAYLHPDHNGRMTEDSIPAYVQAVTAALQSPDALDKLRRGALASAQDYSIEEMADRFCRGIAACIALPKR